MTLPGVWEDSVLIYSSSPWGDCSRIPTDNQPILKKSVVFAYNLSNLAYTLFSFLPPLSFIYLLETWSHVTKASNSLSVKRGPEVLHPPSSTSRVPG